jgi:hypothetical protein
VAVVAHAQFLDGHLDRRRVGLPARRVVTADDSVEPVVDVQPFEDGQCQVLLAVCHDADGCVDGREERLGVVVDVRGVRSRPRVLDGVERLPEPPGVDADPVENLLAGVADAVPEQFGLVAGELAPESVAVPSRSNSQKSYALPGIGFSTYGSGE